jgi:pimeloyl-ACP methyl ester carboxylesterase
MKKPISWLLKALTAAMAVIVGTSFGATRSIGEDRSLSQIAVGLGNFQFADTGNSPIRVWYYRPQALRADSPVVFVMHGVHRDAQRYCKDWTPYAQQRNFLLVCPEFDAGNYSTKAYQCGNVCDESDNPIPESRWTFTTIERLFDYVRASAGNTSRSYYIYGHSAGGQFVHRFVLFMPNARYERAIAANPGWYTMPVNSGHSFPYALRHTELSQERLSRSLGRDFVLLLGSEDVDAEDPNLRKTAAAEEQGATRLERGKNFFQAAQSEARRLGARFNWRLRTVPGAQHSDAQMAQVAAEVLFAKSN